MTAPQQAPHSYGDAWVRLVDVVKAIDEPQDLMFPTAQDFLVSKVEELERSRGPNQRDAVIEECAKACDAEMLIHIPENEGDNAYNSAVEDCSAAIRALKRHSATQPPATDADPVAELIKERDDHV